MLLLNCYPMWYSHLNLWIFALLDLCYLHNLEINGFFFFNFSILLLDKKLMKYVRLPNGTNFRRFDPLISSESSSLLKISFTSRRFFFAFAPRFKLMTGAIIGGVSMLAGLFSDFIDRIDDLESSSFCIPLLFELK